MDKETRAGAACSLAAVRAHARAAIVAKVLCLGLVAACLAPGPAAAVEDTSEWSTPRLPLVAVIVAVPPTIIEALTVAVPPQKLANFELEHASQEAHRLADWIVDSGDNLSMPFAIVDKVDAKVFVFDARGKLHGAAAALLGLALGDDSVPGIGTRAMSSILPAERTTPAGRFVASLDRNAHGKVILWVDYDDAISMHAVIKGTLQERRAQRLASPSTLDNRISYGCINVPAKFFDNIVRPAFTGTNGVVYVLPETKSAHTVFASYDVYERARRLLAKQSASSASERR
jgi:hypothetical protein